MINARFRFCEKIFERVGAFEIQTQFAFANSENVAMRIGQSRNNRVLVEIDRAFSAKFFSRFLRANKNDPVFFDCDRLGVRFFFVQRVNVAVGQEKIDILGRVHR